MVANATQSNAINFFFFFWRFTFLQRLPQKSAKTSVMSVFAGLGLNLNWYLLTAYLIYDWPHWAHLILVSFSRFFFSRPCCKMNTVKSVRLRIQRNGYISQWVSALTSGKRCSGVSLTHTCRFCLVLTNPQSECILLRNRNE